MKISGLTILKNGLKCGYIFVEVIETLNEICDEIIVCEGGSDDGTLEIIREMAEKNPKINLYVDNWNTSSNGFAFRDVTDQGMKRCTGDYIFYLQADEIIHKHDLPEIRRMVEMDVYNSIHFHFAHLRYSVDLKLEGDQGYRNAIRIVRNIPDIRSKYDAYSFEGNIHPGHLSNITVFHAGYVFVENILKKMINHAESFYQKNDNYQDRAKTAKKLLAKIQGGGTVSPEEAHQALEPFYKLKPHGLEVPELLARHRGAMKYTI